MKQEPVLLIELIKVFAGAVMAWVVIMGIWPMTEVQQAATMTMILTGIGLGGAIWQRSQTTNLAAPRDTDGTTLSRPHDVPANKELAALQAEAIAINKEVQPDGRPN